MIYFLRQPAAECFMRHPIAGRRRTRGQRCGFCLSGPISGKPDIGRSSQECADCASLSAVERREAPPPHQRGREASPVSRWGRWQGSAKGGLANLLAPSQVGYTRLAHINEPISGKPEIGCAPSPCFEGKEKREGRARVHKDRAGGALATANQKAC